MLIKYIKLYIEFSKQSIKKNLEYRVDFIIGVLAAILVQLSGILFVWLIFQNVKEIKGWSFYQVTFLYGLMTMSKGFFVIAFNNLWVLGSQYVREGKFDILLLRPISTLFHLIADRLEPQGLGYIAIGLTITIRSIQELNISINFVDIILFIIFIISGASIFGAIQVITSVSSFWIVNSNEFMWTFFQAHEFAQYPITIYNKYIKGLLTWILPYAFASFYPANYFFDKGYYYLSFLSPLVAIIMWIIAVNVWNFGIRNYTSTGS